jgi:hypothetical protein
MNENILRSGLMALALTSGMTWAQDLRLTEFDRQGHIAWSNTPADHVCFVERAAPLPAAAWSNAALCLTAEEAAVSTPESIAFYRVRARGSTHLVHYPLTNSANDALGNYGPMTLINTPFTNGGIYCNGIYQNGVDPDSSYAGTPVLSELDFSNVVMAVDFMVVTNRTSPILVGGNLWRWGGVYTRSDGTVGLLLNGTGPYPGTVAYSTGVWHEAVFVYTASNRTAEIYLDGQLSGRREGDLTDGSDRRICNTHGGNGTTFKGYLRNLRVWNLK